MATQDICDFDRRSADGRTGMGHGRRAPVYPGGITSSDSRSSGLCVARIVWVATCV